MKVLIDNDTIYNGITMEKKDTQPEKEPQLVIPYGYMPYNQPEEDEIDLKELWRTLKRRKKSVMATTAIVFAIAVAYIFLAKPLYEAKATLEIGKELTKNKDGVLVTKYFENSKSLKEHLDVKYDTAGKYRDKNATAYISAVSVPKKGATEGFITITALGENNIDAINMIKKPIEEISASHRAYYDTIIEKKRDAVEDLERQISYDKNTLLPHLKKNLELLQSVELKKIDEKISLVKSIDLKQIEDKISLLKSIDLKKIDDKIDLMKKVEIPALKEKIKQNEAEIAKKEAAIKAMQKEIKRVAKKDPALATMTSMLVANLQNDIGRINIKIIDLESQIEKIRKEVIADLEAKKKRLLEETIPNLEKRKSRLLQETIPNLEAEKRRLLEEVIPQKKADIKRLLTITIPQKQMQISQIKTSMKEPYLVMTHVVGKIYTHDYPVKPKKKLVLAVALVTGLFLGVFLAFFLEFIAKNEKRNESS